MYYSVASTLELCGPVYYSLVGSARMPAETHDLSTSPRLPFPCQWEESGRETRCDSGVGKECVTEGGEVWERKEFRSGEGERLCHSVESVVALFCIVCDHKGCLFFAVKGHTDCIHTVPNRDYRIAGHFHGVKFLWFSRICLYSVEILPHNKLTPVNPRTYYLAKISRYEVYSRRHRIIISARYSIMADCLTCYCIHLV